MDIEDKLVGLNEGIHILCDRVVYVKELNGVKIIKVFDLFNHNEENYVFDKVSNLFLK